MPTGIDFSKYEEQTPTSIDFSKYTGEVAPTAPLPNAGLSGPPSPRDIAARINPQPTGSTAQPVVSGFPIDQRVPNAVRDTASEYVEQGPKKVVSGVRKLAESGALSNLGYMTPPPPVVPKQDTQEALTGASEAMEGLGVTTAPLIGGEALLAPLRVGGSLLAGFATSQVAKKAAESAGVSPEAVRFSENLGWFIPVGAAMLGARGEISTIPGERGAVAEVGPVAAGVKEAPGGVVTVAGKAGPFKGSKTFGGKPEAVPAIEPQTIQGEKGAVAPLTVDTDAVQNPTASGQTFKTAAEDVANTRD